MKHSLNSSNIFFVTIFAVNMMMAMVAGALLSNDLAGVLPGFGKETADVELSAVVAPPYEAKLAATVQHDPQLMTGGGSPLVTSQNHTLLCAQQIQEVVENEVVESNKEQWSLLNSRSDTGRNYFIPSTSRSNAERYSF